MYALMVKIVPNVTIPQFGEWGHSPIGFIMRRKVLRLYSSRLFKILLLGYFFIYGAAIGAQLLGFAPVVQGFVFFAQLA